MLLLDQLTKWWAESTLDDRSIDLFWTLRFHLVLNRAAAFSLGDGLGPFIGMMALVVVGILLWTGRSIGTRLGAIGLGMVLGGALGNILDRAFRPGDGFLGGAVIDFIDPQWWPVFNVADMGVVIGAVLLFIGTIGEEVGADGDAINPADEAAREDLDASDGTDGIEGPPSVDRDDSVGGASTETRQRSVDIT